MSEVATEGWSAEQERLLQAMGFELLRPALNSAGQARAADAAAVLTTLPAANAQSLCARISLLSFPPSAESAQQLVLVALLRAAGLSLDSVQLLQGSAEGVELHVPSLHDLLSSAAARRALWPKLRRLKRERLACAPQ